MNEKEIKRAREEFDEKETMKMIKAINENHERKYNQWLLNEQIKKINNEKHQKKEMIFNWIQVSLIFMILLSLMVLMLMYLEKDGAEFVEQCTAAGYSESYCMSQL